MKSFSCAFPMVTMKLIAIANASLIRFNVTGRFKRDHVGSKLVPFEDFKIPHLGFLI